jgi:hypothetical protein
MTEPHVPPPPPPPPGSSPASGAAEETAAAPPPARVTGLSCPSCGGALDVDAGVRVVVCPFCTTPLLATSELGLRRFAVEPRKDLEAARGCVREWLGSGWNKDRRLPREAELAEAYLSFLPFFRVQADLVGVALGTEERRRTVGSGKNRRTETYEVDVERWVERHFDDTRAAVNVAELGVWHVDLKGDRLVPFDDAALARSGMVFPPTRSEPEVRKEALARFRDEGDPAKGLKRVRFRFVETLREAFTVVYYPLWVVRYRFENRSYLAVVDAEDGTLAYGKAPGNDLYRAAMMIGTEAAVCFAATSVLHWADECGPVVGVFVAGGAALAWAWKRFRYGGVVEEGSGRRREPAAELNRWVRFWRKSPRRSAR